MLKSSHFQSFIAYCHSHGLSIHTIRAYQGDLKNFQDWLIANQFITLDKSTMEGWLRVMRERDHAPTTIKRKLATLKVAFSWLEENELIEESPFRGFKSKIKLPKKTPKSP